MAAAGSATGCVNPRSKNKVVPSSLLENVDADKPLPRRYSLGMDKFVDKSAYEKENRPLSLSLGDILNRHLSVSFIFTEFKSR